MVTMLRQHLQYSAWASSRLLAAAAELSPAELSRDFGTADKSVLGTLVHIFAADRVWLARVEGRPAGPFLTEADYSLEVLRSEWPALLDRWVAWAASLDDETSRGILVYLDLKGREWRHARWRIVLHVVNHAAHHRGQVAGFLRAMGKAPPPLDEILFYRDIPVDG
jgi:uncharacterized damage-inducible protein DinB